MSEDFRKKLEAYEQGTLDDAQQAEMEQELEKLEIYQQFLGEAIGDNASDANRQQEKKIIKRSKRKFAFINVRNTILAVLVLYVPLMILSSIYYNGNNGPDGRLNDLNEAMEVTFSASHPNLRLSGGGTNFRLPFTASINRTITRVIGNEWKDIGELEGNIGFSSLTIADTNLREWTNSRIASPTDGDIEWAQENNENQFNRLEQLGSGTMAELYLSFNEPLTLDETFDLLRDKDIHISWMAVITEPLIDDEWDSHISRLGMPGDSFIMRQNQDIHIYDNGWSASWEAPIPFGDASLREQQFMQALQIMEQHPSVVNRLTFMRENAISDAIAYLEENGLKLRGVLITGPTTELLTLRDEPWIFRATIGEVTFINWGF